MDTIKKRDSLRTGTAMAFMLILIASTVVFAWAAASSLKLKIANAQVDDDNCPVLPITSVVASGEEDGTIGNVASNAIDKNPNTRWSNFGKGSFIQADLGHSAILCSVDILWLYGNSRTYNFVISVSNDGTHFSNVLSAKSTGETNSAERYKVSPVTARYMRITVDGNNENDWVNITEMAINGQQCTAPPRISNAPTASGDDGNVPQNTLDSKLGTRWSNSGFPSWIQYNLGESQPVCSVDIAWYRGNFRVNTFMISTSNDGINFTPVFSGKSSGKTMGLERYDIPDTFAKYIRITVTGNTENNWSSVSEVRINGGVVLECKSPQISAVSASGNQEGNTPQNTLDNNIGTRWSNFGLPSYIQYNLGESQPVCSVDIAWYRGNFRVNTFMISTSNDGVNFTPVFSGKSSGKTMGLERYDIPDTFAKYFRITVLDNTENNWASITIVDINSQAPTPPPSQEVCGNGVDDNGNGQVDEGCPPPPPSQEICGNGVDDNGNGQVDEGCPPPSQEICGNGVDDNGNGQVDEGCPPSDGGGQKDPFGIQKIYPTKQGGEEWFMDMTDGKDPRSDPPSMTKNSDGSFKVKSTKVRYGVFTTAGYDANKIESLDQADLEEKGYSQSPNDWKNFEITGYVKVNKGNSDENFAWYGRGGRHTGNGSPEGCEGTAYKGDLFYDGRVRFAKEQWHVSYVFTDHKEAMSSIEGKWVGFKTIMWNMVQDGKTVVKMEIWVDKNEDGNQDGPWEKVDENIDGGGWGTEGGECGGKPDQILSWGGPIATFRWDGATDVDIKNFSVREIQPPS
jgi:F5/8 type C domain/Putative metal-binding motif